MKYIEIIGGENIPRWRREIFEFLHYCRVWWYARQVGAPVIYDWDFYETPEGGITYYIYVTPSGEFTTKGEGDE